MALQATPLAARVRLRDASGKSIMSVNHIDPAVSAANMGRLCDALNTLTAATVAEKQLLVETMLADV